MMLRLLPRHRHQLSQLHPAVQQPPLAPGALNGHFLHGRKHLGGGGPDGSWSTLEPHLPGSQMLTSSSKSFPRHVIREPPRRRFMGPGRANHQGTRKGVQKATSLLSRLST